MGLEIGGPSGMFGPTGLFPVYAVSARVDNCNFAVHTTWEGQISEGITFQFSAQKAPGRQYIAEADDLEQVPSDSYDFVLSSHCLEHVANPLKAIAEWKRVLKEQGLLVLVVPHKDATFDHRRPVTSLDHMIEDLERQVDKADMTHLEEILSLHDLAQDPEAGDIEAFTQRSARNAENRCLHHHVFDTCLAVEIMHYSGLQILTVEALSANSILVTAKNPRRGQATDNRRFRGIGMERCWQSPFPSDRRSAER